MRKKNRAGSGKSSRFQARVFVLQWNDGVLVVFKCFLDIFVYWVVELKFFIVW